MHPDGTTEDSSVVQNEGTRKVRRKIEEDLLRDKEEVLARLREKVDYRVPVDVHEYISGFACFRESESGSQTNPANPIFKKEKNKKKANRARNKMAKKAKRKNRK